MPIQPIETNRLYRRIADQLSALIDSGEFPAGSRLPSERDLSLQLGVSRPSVREGLIALEVSGKVVIRVGSGVFVTAQRPTAVLDAKAEGLPPFELVHARWLIEGEIAAEAATRARPEDLDLAREALARMTKMRGHKSETDAADRDFHVAIAKAAHNGALTFVVQDLWDHGRGAIYKRMEYHFETPELRAAALRDHRAILTAVERGDSASARLAMRRHLERVEAEFSRGWEALQGEKQDNRAKSRAPRAARK